MSASQGPSPRTTLESHLESRPLATIGLNTVISSIAAACLEIAAVLHDAPLTNYAAPAEFATDTAGGTNPTGDVQKPLDVYADAIVSAALKKNPFVAVTASEEHAEPSLLSTPDPDDPTPRFTVVLDPLDGSRNIDASIPTGTIFGILPYNASLTPLENATQDPKNYLAAGYALYSSATVLAIAVEGASPAVISFAADGSTGEWVRCDADVKVPPRGQLYSVNDARFDDWSAGLRSYVTAVRRGAGETGKQYSLRYVCALVADVHRTVRYGGTAMNPRGHLRVVFEANPLAFLVGKAGGRATDGVQDVLEKGPAKELHERAPLFLGSRDDIAEMLSYGDLQQKGDQTYAL